MAWIYQRNHSNQMVQIYQRNDSDFTTNSTYSTETSSFKQKDRLSTIIAVSNDVDYSKESNRRDKDWEASVGN